MMTIEKQAQGQTWEGVFQALGLEHGLGSQDWGQTVALTFGI